ncbi:MAG: 4Fe-4S binding protein [candidate division Zixibacteria bacterium]|nr:4Fe-4S binding protein [candidate division Zixibacteria bacterium]
MPVRNIIHIDEERCDGCGDCITACAEGALRLVNGKAKLVSDTYCDGLGACIGNCPQGAITIEQREAPAYDEIAVEKHLAAQRKSPAAPATIHHACPGSAARSFTRPDRAHRMTAGPAAQSQLGQWPVQLMLVPPHAPYLQGADLLVCADCVPFAVPDFHDRYLAGRAVLVGCPKLDDLNFYYQKLLQIFAQARPSRITVLKMEVPCCGGLAQAAISARDETAPDIPLEIHTIGIRTGISIQTVPAAMTEVRREADPRRASNAD